MRSFKKIQWALRKIFLPVYYKKIVIDLGSGANPHPAADILIEKYIKDEQRVGAIKHDKRIILADGEFLPIKDKQIDYLICFHVLEHVDNPSNFLKEMQRVSVAGYIETPNIMYESLHPYDVHLTSVYETNSTLNIVFKKDRADQITAANILKYDSGWRKIFYRNPKLFHVNFYWKDTINYNIQGKLSKKIKEKQTQSTINDGFMGVKQKSKYFTKFIFLLMRKIKIKKSFTIHEILCCPLCKGELDFLEDSCKCVQCNKVYIKDIYWDFRV